MLRMRQLREVCAAVEEKLGEGGEDTSNDGHQVCPTSRSEGAYADAAGRYGPGGRDSARRAAASNSRSPQAGCGEHVYGVTRARTRWVTRTASEDFGHLGREEADVIE
eukprot:15267838-Heterocapsa_arctica.AAC.1